MHLQQLDHIGIAVEDLDKAMESYGNTLGMDMDSPEILEDRGIKICVVHAGRDRLELIAPLHEQSQISSFLKKRGEGLHHVAVQVDDIDAALEHFKKKGMRLIDKAPRLGAHKTRVAFVHPSCTHGVLLELVEHDCD